MVIIKGLLRAIAMMHIPVHYQHPLFSYFLRVARRYGDVVEYAESHPLSGIA